jgi:hypothetical protein
MLKLDNNLLEELGLGSLPEAQKRQMLQHIYDTLELRVGTQLANQMTDKQLEEFEKFIDSGGDANQAQALQWLESNLPNYKDVVQQTFDALKLEVKGMASQLLASAAQQPQEAQIVSQQPYAPAAPQQQAYAMPQPPSPQQVMPSQQAPMNAGEPWQQPAQPQQPPAQQYPQASYAAQPQSFAATPPSQPLTPPPAPFGPDPFSGSQQFAQQPQTFSQPEPQGAPTPPPATPSWQPGPPVQPWQPEPPKDQQPPQAA